MATAISPHLLLVQAVTEFGRLSDPTLLTFPADDPDPVIITDKDMQSLQPMEHLSINIIDFYIKYLQKEVLPLKDKVRFFFFHCFFFIRTFGAKSASTDIDYEQARKWTQGVNLFEKDYIFIPVYKSLSGSHVCGERILNGSEHWSLIIIFHLSSLTKSHADVHYHSPCIFHLDSVEGNHDDFEGDIRSFIFKSWIDIHQNLNIIQALFHMKYVQAEVPQQDNGCDSGIYMLHYVELFILESASPDFSFGSRQGKPHFTCWDTSEVVSKRKHIQNLILKLSGMTQLQLKLRLHSRDIFSWLEGKATSEGRIENVQNNDLTMVNAKGAESEHGDHQTGGVTLLNDYQSIDINESFIIPCSNLLSNRPGVSEVTSQHQSEEIILPSYNDTLILRKEVENRRLRDSNWSGDETSVLLKCKVEGGRFRKGNATRWDLISEEIEKVSGTTHTKEQCQRRFDTLYKAYKSIEKHCSETNQEFSEIMEKEQRGLKLATTFTREWYYLMREIYARWPRKENPLKRDKRPVDSPPRSAAEIQTEDLADHISTSPCIDTGNLPSRSAGEFLTDPTPVSPCNSSPSNRLDATPVPESRRFKPRPRLVRKGEVADGSFEDPSAGVYRRPIKDRSGMIRGYKYEPRFKPPREILSTGETVKFNSLSLGSYDTLLDAKTVRQIAAFYYGKGDRRLDLEHGGYFLIPDLISYEEPLRGRKKMKWVESKAREVFKDFRETSETGACFHREQPNRLRDLFAQEPEPLENQHSFLELLDNERRDLLAEQQKHHLETERHQDLLL